MFKFKFASLLVVVWLFVFAGVALAQDTYTVNKSSNLRAGPGVSYAVVGNAKPGQEIAVVGKSADGKWLKLEDGKWIAGFLADKKAVSTVAPAVTAVVTGDYLTSAQRRYIDNVWAASKIYKPAMAKFNGLAARLADNPSLVTNTSWMREFDAAIDSLSLVKPRINSVPVPAGMNVLGLAVGRWAASVDRVASYCSVGVYGANRALLNACVNELDNIDAFTEQIIVAMVLLGIDLEFEMDRQGL